MAAVERKLTTILCADVEGYSRLMGRDEVGTLDVLKRHRAAMRGLIERHRGRVVNTWGDGLIADFPSVVEAVTCAVEVQKELAARNDGLLPGERLDFRIGINLGDVMVEDGDLYGEGVNVAARLQGLADPGGIVISRPVHDQVRGKLQMGFDYAGPQAVKNIAEPVEAYRVRTDGVASGLPPPPHAAAARQEPRPRGRLRALAAEWPLLTRWLQVTGVFVAINLLASPHQLWFQWPALGIGIALLLRSWTRRR